MATELMQEKWTGRVWEVNLGSTSADGGSRRATFKIGGQTNLPFLSAEGEIPHRPLIAFEVWDTPPLDWPAALTGAYGEVLKQPLDWAEMCIKKFRAQILCLKLQGAHPDFGNKSADEEVSLVSQLLKKVDVPLIISGCGDDAKDNQVLPLLSQITKGERCLFGSAVQDNYKTLTAAVLADGHNIIAESPIDINIAKQLNILISDMGLPLERIVINPTIGALGYGLEYAYSIMERARLSALAGDKSVASPFICFVAQESWRAKEAKESQRGIFWEIITATALLQAGADLLVMRHPRAIEKVNTYIENLIPKKG